MNTYTEAVILGMVAGFLARLYMLRTDYRNYPSYPHGYIIHLSLGAIAASLAPSSTFNTAFLSATSPTWAMMSRTSSM